MAKIERTKNAGKSAFFGAVLKIYQTVLPFLMRTAMIYCMGAQYLGLNSLFASILQVLNLAELGVGSAMVYSMYEPIARDDIKKVNGLLFLYKKYYWYIGLFILAAGIAITPFVPRLISGSLPSDVNIYILYWIQLASTVLSYWVFAYKNSLLTAYQRNDVGSIISIGVNTVTYLGQFWIIFGIRNYYCYIIVSPVMQVVNNLIMAYVVQRIYPQYKAEGGLIKEETSLINERMRDIFTAKLGGVVVNSADALVISAFLGLSALAVYQNYYFIVNAIYGFVAVLTQSCTAGVGNSLVTESIEKNYRDFQKLTVLFMMIVNSASCCFLNLFQPFMRLWMGPELMLAYPMVVLFVVYYATRECMDLFSLYKDASGIWHQDRFRPLCEAGLNLGLNLVMVQFWGVYGILLSTIISMALFSIPWLVYNLFAYVFQRGAESYLRLLSTNLGVIVLSGASTYILCSRIQLSGIPELVVKLIVSGGGSLAIYMVIFHKSKLLLEAMELLNRASGNRLGVLMKILHGEQSG